MFAFHWLADLANTTMWMPNQPSTSYTVRRVSTSSGSEPIDRTIGIGAAWIATLVHQPEDREQKAGGGAGAAAVVVGLAHVHTLDMTITFYNEESSKVEFSTLTSPSPSLSPCEGTGTRVLPLDRLPLSFMRVDADTDNAAHCLPHFNFTAWVEEKGDVEVMRHNLNARLDLVKGVLAPALEAAFARRLEPTPPTCTPTLKQAGELPSLNHDVLSCSPSPAVAVAVAVVADPDEAPPPWPA